MIYKEAKLKNIEQTVDSLIKIASNKNLSLHDEAVLVKNLKDEYFNVKASIDYTPVTSAQKITVFNKELMATPITNQKTFDGYDISQDGKKLFNIKAKANAPMNIKQLEFCAQIELTRGMKQAKLVEKIAFLPAGSKVYILAEDKAARRTKFASLDQGLKGWVSSSKLKLIALESQPVTHGDHQDKILGQTKTQTLLDCIQAGPTWVSSAELMDANRPMATPESLNDLESAQKCKECGKETVTKGYKGGYCSECANNKESSQGYPENYFKYALAKQRADQSGLIDVEDDDLTSEGLAAKKQEMVEGHDIQDKQALETALPTQILPQRGDVNETNIDTVNTAVQQKSMELFKQPWDALNPQQQEMINKALGVTSSLKDKGVGEFECFECGKSFVSEGKLKDHMDTSKHKSPKKTSSLKVQAHIREEDGKWIVYNHDYKKKLGTYGTKQEAVKRLRQIEYFKNASLKPFSKKAEVMADPYANLTTHITEMRGRMDAVQERIQVMPAVKTAEEGAPEMDLAALFADLSQGINLLETKLGGEEASEHEMIEELENKLWKLEEECGITPNLSDEEKAEPEHKEIVEDIEKEADQVTDETITTTNDPNAIPPATSATPAPVIQNVQPTDQDNLEVPIAKPTSPPAPGQIWVFNSDPAVMAYVSMPDPANPGKTI